MPIPENRRSIERALAEQRRNRMRLTDDGKKHELARIEARMAKMRDRMSPEQFVRAQEQFLKAASRIGFRFRNRKRRDDGSMPALVKAFFEQAFRPGFAVTRGEMSLNPGLLKGKSVRIVVTMGMPALVYRWFFLAHSLKSLERNILKFAGLKPIRETLIGGVESIGDGKRKAWLETLRRFGREGQ